MWDWTWDPFVTAGLASVAVAYGRGLYVLRRRRSSGQSVVAPWRIAVFASGWLTVVLALLSPLDPLSDRLFAAHMTQHELLMLVAAPLLVLGLPLVVFLWALPARARVSVASWSRSTMVRRTWRALTGPVFVLVAHAIALWIWHVPALFESAMHHEAVHAFQHLMFFWTAALFWYALIHGRYGRIGYGVSVLFVFITATHTSVLGAMLTFAGQVWYPSYAHAGLEDQQVAGLVMWVPSGAILTVVGLGLFAAWLGESERRARYAQAAEVIK